MSTRTIIPCRRPKITYDGDTHRCQVPGCGWTFRSVKSALDVTWHRAEHRAAVPSVSITRENGHPYRVACSCGHVRCDSATTTRVDAEGVRDFHLFDVHGLVTCP